MVFVETDYFGVYGYMTADQGVRNGSDLMLCTTGNDFNKMTVLTNSSKQAMRTSAKNILYTVVNSNAMNGWASTDTLKTITPWWQTAIYALIAVLAVLTILCAWQLSKALKAKKSMVDTAPAADQK